MPRLYETGGNDEDPGLPIEEDSQAVQDFAALDALTEAWHHLCMRAHQGDRFMLERLIDLARDTSDFLNPDPAEDAGKLAEALAEMAANLPEWPMLVPGDGRDLEAMLARARALKIGSRSSITKQAALKKERGRPMEDRRIGSPSHVAKILVCRIEGIRRSLQRRDPALLALLCRKFEKPFLKMLGELPPFSEASMREWKEAAHLLAGVPEPGKEAVAFLPGQRERYIPRAWNDEAPNQEKGKGAHARRKIADGMKAVCPSP